MKKYLVLILTLALLLPMVVVTSQAKLRKREQVHNETAPASLNVNGKLGQKGGDKKRQPQPVSSKAIHFAVSAPLSEMPAPTPERNRSIRLAGQEEGHEINEQNAEEIKHAVPGVQGSFDPLIQTNLLQNSSAAIDANAPAAMPTPALTFEGLSSQDNLNASGGSTVMPPDTEGDVGPNHYVEGTNFLFTVYNKTGTNLLAGGRRYSQLFAPIGGQCAARNDGDPIIQYDQLADRWMISQFCTANDPFNHQLMAISTTADPTGSYYLYDFQMPNIHFPDYPHYGVWPDGYYMIANVFQSTSNIVFYGAGAYAFDRRRMLAGDPAASFIYIDESLIDPTLGGQLPTDADGLNPPPPGLPNLFCEFRDTEFGDPIDALRCFEFRPNFDNPGATTYTQIPDIPTAPFDGRNPSGRVDVEQPSPATASHNLDSLGGRLMYRLAYRNLGTSSAPVNSYVTNWTVNVSGVTPSNAATYQAGIRWTELRRDPSTNAMSIRDQGTYVNGAISGATGENDWMGSAAQDNQGNIALGYSASSTSLLPAIKWAGRTGTGTTGTLNEGEALVFASTGVQSATNSRWGDYSSMSVDPVDDCTFWYAQEYRLAANNSAAGTFPFLWNTRIGSFKFPGCTAAPRGTITGQVTLNGNPVANASVYTSNGFFRLTDANGNYTISNVGPDTYTVTAFKSGIGVAPTSAAGVVVTNGNTTIQNIALTPAADVALFAATISEGPFSNGNGRVDPGETGNIVVTLNDPAAIPATGVTATLSVKRPTAGVTIAQPNTRSLGTIPGNGSVSTESSPFRFVLSNIVAVATTVDFVLRVDFSGGQSPTFLEFSYFVGGTPVTVSTLPSTTLDTTPPAVPAGATGASTGTQTGRVVRTGVGTGCGTPKANPGLNDVTPNRQYDAYTFTNSSTDALCATFTVNQASTLLYAVVYGNGGFNPASPAQNFLGDPGSSAATMTFSVDIPPMSSYTLVVHEVTVGAGIGQAYNATVTAVPYGLPPVRRRADFDVDKKSDVSVWRPSEGFWYYRNSSTGVIQRTFWGAATDKPVPGDYDGDGQTDFAVYRPSENNWYIRNSFDSTGTVKSFGTGGDTPVPGDYDGDGKTDIAVFRPSEGKWYVLQSWSNTLRAQAWGTATDTLAPGDYDGDGKTDFAVFRPSEGNWYIRNSGGGANTIRGWGLSTDLIVPADYDGDRKTDIAVFRPSEGNWYIIQSTGGAIVRNWGNSTDKPVPGDYDGDGKADIAVFRESEGNWYVINSSGSPAASLYNLGTTGDRPVPYDYIPNP